MVSVPETCDVYHNKGFVKGALRSALNELLVFVLDDFPGIKDFFDDAVNQVALATEVISDSCFSGCERYRSYRTYCSVCCKECETKSEKFVTDLGFTASRIHRRVWIRFPMRLEKATRTEGSRKNQAVAGHPCVCRTQICGPGLDQ